MTRTIEVDTAAEARKIELELAKTGVSYRTSIVRSRKRGLKYVVTIFSAG